NKEVFFENGFALQNEVIELPELIAPKKYRIQKDKYIEQELKTINRFLGFQKENGFAKQNDGAEHLLDSPFLKGECDYKLPRAAEAYLNDQTAGCVIS